MDFEQADRAVSPSSTAACDSKSNSESDWACAKHVATHISDRHGYAGGLRIVSVKARKRAQAS